MVKFSFIRKKLKLNKKRALLKQLSLLIATAMLFTVAVWAWFASQDGAEADGLVLTMGTSKNLEISLDGGTTYHYGLDLLSADTQQYISESNKIKDKLQMQDITSDGKTFLRPVFNQADGIRTPDVTQNWSTANKNTAYISQTIKFRTTFPAEIYMGADTQVVTYSENNDLELTGTSAGHKSSYGDFSKDCIVGALRISAIDSDNNLCFTMIPRSDIELVVNGSNYSVTKTADGSPASSNSKVHTYYASDYQTSKATTTNSTPLLEFTAVEDTKPSDETTRIATTALTESGYYEGVATVNIWLEGCDAETRRALSGGEYNINLDFVAYEILDTTASEE